ncbi:predicted protein [Lichtheimia corymbifera JMRC:FSU:9682]|uniref:Uncharacterized protein n=1 Tax=Lichtheimia corymbifera JMRC:FSU:9682 TaxID=1263082 RepID=A0A068RVG6_9FUNG|nr:predicted protein [Lichtheimia corymbifera JMRC:FSU:9682]
MPTTGIEPVTFRLLGGRSAKLSQAGLILDFKDTTRPRQLPYLEGAPKHFKKLATFSGGNATPILQNAIIVWKVSL